MSFLSFQPCFCLLSSFKKKKTKHRSNICPYSLLAAQASLEYLMSHKVVNKCLLSDFFWLLEYIVPLFKLENFHESKNKVDHFYFFLAKKISRQFSCGFALLTLSLCIPCGVLWHERPPNWKLRKYVRDTPSLMSSGFAPDFH